MRTYGRITIGKDPVSGLPIRQWVMVETEADGSNDKVYLTALCQTLLGLINESPFYADWGIPARDSIMQQVMPDFYVSLTQQRFSSRFANLTVAKLDLPTPTYRLNVITHTGVKLNANIPIPQ